MPTNSSENCNANFTHSLFETYQKDFLFYQQVLAQQPKDKNKIYSPNPKIEIKKTHKAQLV
ncbi:hypothetical protein [uncultured Gammaproteobacteria bacterium]|nr:hypothetical protein [uncultured Gammaproteobacteria bacterium]